MQEFFNSDHATADKVDLKSENSLKEEKVAKLAVTCSELKIFCMRQLTNVWALHIGQKLKIDF